MKHTHGRSGKQTMEEALRYFAARIPEEAPNTFSGQMCPQLVSCDEKPRR